MKVATSLLMAFLCAVANENRIEIYTNTAFLHQNFGAQKSTFSTFVPYGVDANSIEINASCDVLNLTLGNQEIVKDDIFNKTKAQETQLQRMQNELEALMKKQGFFEKFAPSENLNVSELGASGDKFAQVLLQNLEQIQAQKQRIDEYMLQINSAPTSYVRRLELQFACEPKFVNLSYPVLVEARLQNTIQADSLNNKIDITQNLILKNMLGFELKNLQIALYPFAYSTNLAPQAFYPRYEGKNEAEKRYAGPVAAAPMASKVALESTERSLKTAQGVSLQGTLLNTWKISDVNLKNSEEKELKFDVQNLDAKFDVVIDGYGTKSGYVRAKFTPNKSIQGAQSVLKLDGFGVGSVYFASENDQEASVYFGENRLINVKKQSPQNFTKEAFFGNKNTNLKTYEYEIKNSSSRNWSVTLLEQVPVSTHEDVKVAVKNAPKEDEISKQGEVSWKFELKPNESKKIEFSYELTKPK